jgi:hypothetical protein
MLILFCSIAAAIAVFTAVAFYELWHAAELVESTNANRN